VKDATRVIRAGLPQPAANEPFMPGPTFAAPFHLPGDPADAEYEYTRYGNPTTARLEAAIGELEGGEAVVFASGMGAVAAAYAVFGGRPKELPGDAYMGSRHLAEHLGEQGTLIWLETPANPTLEITDIAAAVQAADGPVAVDNTTATPLGQRPLELGATLSVASASKALTGHSDLIMGYVATRDPEVAERLRQWRILAGAVAGPFESWLAHRSLATLELRTARQQVNALAVAEAVGARGVPVRYPGLPSDPGHEPAARQMSRFGCVVGFDLGRREAAERFLSRAELVWEATSFGGVVTTAERRARWGGDPIGEGFIRFSAGCEDAEDLVADVEQALDASAQA